MEDKKFNVLNPDEYLANNPFMQHNHMYITEIGTETSEIRMEVHPDGLNIMGQVHGGLLYSLADVFVNPTYVDNFPTTNIEALACGTPVVTYRTGGSPEAIDEFTGMAIGQGNVEQLRGAVEHFAMNKASYSMACRERSVKCFNKQDRFNDYVGLFDNLIKK